jgi:hypothetical protein
VHALTCTGFVLNTCILGIEQLKTAASERRYHDVGNLLGAIDQLLRSFDDYTYVPYIQSLNETAAVIKEDISKQMREEFNRFGNSCTPFKHLISNPFSLTLPSYPSQRLHSQGLVFILPYV